MEIIVATLQLLLFGGIALAFVVYPLLPRKDLLGKGIKKYIYLAVATVIIVGFLIAAITEVNSGGEHMGVAGLLYLPYLFVIPPFALALTPLAIAAYTYKAKIKNTSSYAQAVKFARIAAYCSIATCTALAYGMYALIVAPPPDEG